MKGNETLLDKAETNMRAALWLLAKDSDEAFINLAAYHVQRSYELMYKHILELYGVKYNFNHDIQQLIDACIEHNLIFPYNTYIEDNADVITVMESKTRYIKNYMVSLNTVKRALNALKTLLETTRELEDLSAVNFFKTNTVLDNNLSDAVALAKNYYPNDNAKQFILVTFK